LQRDLELLNLLEQGYLASLSFVVPSATITIDVYRGKWVPCSLYMACLVLLSDSVRKSRE
jgi:hypothetical protein